MIELNKLVVEIASLEKAMLTEVNPKLPMRDKGITKAFYVEALGFQEIGGTYDDYLMVRKDNVQLHFFLFRELNPRENYGQVYIRTDQVDNVYQWVQSKGVAIHPAGHLQSRPWGQREFSILDPDNNLLTFGQTESDRD